jgi:ABC-2 type transport system ATP-binding protein
MNDPTSTPLLEARALAKRFGGREALRGVDLALWPGRVCALLGSNGAGKTTLLRVLCGLLAPDSGQVILPRSAPGSALVRQVGYCPQELLLWTDLSCLEQLVFVGELHGLLDAKARAMSLLARFGLEARAHSLGGELSGGMRRRLSLAMALLHAPPILILDEPEVGLDPQSRAALRDTLRALADEGKAVLLSTHDAAEAKNADEVVVLDAGRVVAQGSPSEVVARAGVLDLEGALLAQVGRGWLE